MQAPAATFLALTLLGFPARAQAPSSATAVQTLHGAVAAAWALMPQRRDFATRQAEAAARYNAGGAFFPNAPSLTGSYIDDRATGSNQGYVTSQAELSTPIWLPGQGTAMQATASADIDAATAAVEAAHLGLAAEVLDLAAQAAIAVNARGVAARRVATTQALARDVGHRLQVGEASDSDSLAASADVDAAQMTLEGAQAQLEGDRAALAAITGVPTIPRLVASPSRGACSAGSPSNISRGPGADAIAAHPQVIAAERAVAAAQANARLVAIENRDSPEIGVEGINEKQPGTRWDTRFGITFRLPFATPGRNRPRQAAAESATTQAQVQLELTRRNVAVRIRQATALLVANERSVIAGERAAGDLERRRGQVERAWRQGEMPLVEVVRANALAFDADYARGKARTDLDAARVRLCLAEGVLP